MRLFPLIAMFHAIKTWQLMAVAKGQRSGIGGQGKMTARSSGVVSPAGLHRRLAPLRPAGSGELMADGYCDSIVKERERSSAGSIADLIRLYSIGFWPAIFLCKFDELGRHPKVFAKHHLLFDSL